MLKKWHSGTITGILVQSVYISSGIVPTEWKLARVTPIFKKVERQDVNNYRPISIIPQSRRYSGRKHNLRSILQVSYDNDLLANCHSGFRQLNSTLTSLPHSGF